MGPGRNRPGARPGPRLARRVPGQPRRWHRTQACADACPPGGGRDPDGRARRGRRVHRRDRAAARPAGRTRGARAEVRLRGDRPRLPQAPDLPGRARRRLAPRPAQAVPRIRGDAARPWREGRGADRPVLPRPCAARTEAVDAAGGAGGEASVVHGQAAAPVPARAARLAARRRGGREDDARRDRRHRGRDDPPEPACVLVDQRRAVRRAERALGSKAASGSSSWPPASTCRSGASSRAAPRWPTGCAARCSTTSRSPRR